MRARAGGLAALLLAAALAPRPAAAHHGTAAASAIGADGPGAALDTTSPLPLGRGTLLLLAKAEHARFEPRSGVADPKRAATFGTLAVGYGLTPWLSAFVLQPYAVKAQAGTGTSRGPGDPSLMLAAALKWDDGLRLAPERESLDDLADWHLGLWAACTLPTGPTGRRDARGDAFAPDMQPGFGAPSPSAGVAALKQLTDDLTVLAEASHQRFLEHAYPAAGLRYRFGAETRVNAAAAWRAWAAGGRRVDLVPELQLLDLQRDREDGAPLPASGGTVLYGQLGARATLGGLSVAVGVKRALARSLHEAADQQGAEGLEALRASLVVGWSTRP